MSCARPVQNQQLAVAQEPGNTRWQRSMHDRLLEQARSNVNHERLSMLAGCVQAEPPILFHALAAYTRRHPHCANDNAHLRHPSIESCFQPTERLDQLLSATLQNA